MASRRSWNFQQLPLRTSSSELVVLYSTRGWLHGKLRYRRKTNVRIYIL